MILLSSSVNEVLFIAFRLSSNCPTEVAPIMTEVTKSSFSTHANAISAKVCPRCSAISFRVLILHNTSSVNCSFLRKPPRAIRESSGIPLMYRLVNNPCANGEKAMNPVPFSLACCRMPSSSGSRLNRLYLP